MLNSYYLQDPPKTKPKPQNVYPLHYILCTRSFVIVFCKAGSPFVLSFINKNTMTTSQSISKSGFLLEPCSTTNITTANPSHLSHNNDPNIPFKHQTNDNTNERKSVIAYTKQQYLFLSPSTKINNVVILFLLLL